jgi:hypothetical protein
MSAAKNIRCRKKAAPQNSRSAAQSNLPAKPRLQIQCIEKSPLLAVVHEGDAYQFVSTVPLSHLRACGARLNALMEALGATRQPYSAKARRAVVNRLAALEQGSRNRRYRQILEAIARAVSNEEGLNRAGWTALRAVEMIFKWTNEYRFAFSPYSQRLKQDRQPKSTRQPQSALENRSLPIVCTDTATPHV